MTLTLELPHELEVELSEDARRRGVSLEEHVRSLLVEHCLSTPLLHDGEELLAGWQKEEVFGSQPGILDSEAHARSLPEEAERLDRPGLKDLLLADAPRADLPESPLRGRRR